MLCVVIFAYRLPPDPLSGVGSRRGTVHSKQVFKDVVCRDQLCSNICPDDRVKKYVGICHFARWVPIYLEHIPLEIPPLKGKYGSDGVLLGQEIRVVIYRQVLIDDKAIVLSIVTDD